MFNRNNPERAERERESYETLLMAELIGLGTTMCSAMDANPGFVPCGHAFGVLLDGLQAAAVHASTKILREQVDQVHARSEHIAEHRGVLCGAVTAPYCGEGREPLADAIRDIKQAACVVDDSGCENEEACVAIARVLAGIGDPHCDAVAIAELAAEALRLAHQYD